MLPKKLQDSLVSSSSKVSPFMGFVVEPYAFFLCHEIKDLKKAESLLPEGFGLLKTSVFAGDEAKYYAIFGCFRAHTSAFWGARVELYIIAEDKKSGLLSWIIVDYDSNTISFDKKNGLKDPNCKSAVLTVNHSGELFVDMQRDDKKRGLVLESNITNGIRKPLDQRLWLEGNLSIGYGNEIAVNGAEIFSLRFDPKEMESALEIPLRDLKISLNTWYPDLFEQIPSVVLCFPYAQHFISDSPGSASNLKSREELIAANSRIDFAKLKVFSVDSFHLMFMLGTAFSFILTVILVLLLIWRW